MTIEERDKKINFLQYLNTVILTIIATVISVLLVMLTNVRKDQTDFAGELLRLKTVQDINVAAVKDIDTRVTTLELNYLDYIKTWVDQNYVRKPQK